EPAAPTPAAAEPVPTPVVAEPSPAPTPTPTLTVAPKPTPRTAVGGTDGMPFDRDEVCAAAGITLEQLAELESFGLVTGRGSGRDVTFSPDAVAVAVVAAKFLANGIDARHLRTWRQAADREAALFEQRIMPLLRQRNPQSRQAALDTLTELADLGGALRAALVDSALRHHFDGA
ncbi:MAG: putative MerR family transcriptional regulator, partial [Ilumatobacteraceae bacterium]|nr:putative MerR family transcriptional regulator [Ilumatobacteraceae bacterium]